ncbi:hypothetical protein HYV74_04090 [Candidatus Uhrbacteria bacterium]|nr:hypothetical protein [Candidatus Uhrbacteria bacterium]
MHPYPHSMALLKSIATAAPPFTPEPTIRAARAAYERLLRMPPSHTAELEEVLVAYGKILWPYRKALEALVREHLEAHDFDRFVAKLDRKLREKYAGFRADGGSILLLHDTSRIGGRFTTAELGALCAVLAEARREAETHVRAAIVADATEYQQRVRVYAAIQHEIEQHLANLRRLADRIAHDDGAHREIHEVVRQFERGLAHLAVEPTVAEVCTVTEAYHERHHMRKDHAFRRELFPK